MERNKFRFSPKATLTILNTSQAKTHTYTQTSHKLWSTMEAHFWREVHRAHQAAISIDCGIAAWGWHVPKAGLVAILVIWEIKYGRQAFLYSCLELMGWCGVAVWWNVTQWLNLREWFPELFTWLLHSKQSRSYKTTQVLCIFCCWKNLEVWNENSPTDDAYLLIGRVSLTSGWASTASWSSAASLLWLLQ